MKRFLLLLTLFCTIFGGTAKADVVTIGDSTSTTYSTYLPFYTLYNYGWSQQIFTAAEIGTAGTINSLTMWMYYSGSLSGIDIAIYMAEVDAESFADGSSWVAMDESQLVYSGTLSGLPTSAATSGPITFAFETPFAYSGSSNLLIAIANNTGSYSSGFNCRVSDAPAANMAMYAYRDASAYDISNPGVTGTLLAKRDVIQLGIIPGGGPVGPTCDKPTNLAVTPSARQAAVTWDGGDEGATFDVEYISAAKLAEEGKEAHWTSFASGTTLKAISITNLEPNTGYSVRVKAVCGEGVESAWVTKAFTTANELPLSENFDSSSIPTGWSQKSGLLENVMAGTATLSSGSGWTCGTANNVFDNHVRKNVYGTSCYSWLVTPAMEMATGVQLTFNVALTVYTSGSNARPTPGNQPDDKFVVLMSSNGGATWTILQQWDNTDNAANVYDSISNAGQEVVIDIDDSYAGMAVQFAFYGESTVSNGDNNLHIDNVRVGRPMSCFAPTDVTEVAGGISKNSIQIDWTSEATEWKVQYKKSSATAWQSVMVTEKPYTLAGLDEYTTYDIRVAALCTPSDPLTLTDYSAAIKVTTATGLPFVQPFSKSSFPSDWKRYKALWGDVQNGAELEAVSAGWLTVSKTGTNANGVFPDSAYHLYLNIADTACKHWVVSPTITMEAGYQLSLKMALTKSSGTTQPVEAGEQDDDQFIVFVNDNGDWIPLRTWSVNSSFKYHSISNLATGEVFNYDLSDYAGHNIQIAFYGESTDANGNNNLHISSVTIDSIPDCQPALSLAVSGIGAYTATVAWKSEDAEATWEYGCVANPAANFAPTDADFVHTTTEKSLVLDTLTETTNYAFFVRRACQGGGSDYLMETFTTIQNPVSLSEPYNNNFDAQNGWLFINGDRPNKWVWDESAHTGESGKALYISNDNGASNKYSMGTGNATIVYATKTFYFDQAGQYSFQYDWKAWGYSTYDFLRVALIPAEVELEAGTTVPSGFTSSALPTGWIALDGGSKLNLDSAQWNHVLVELDLNKVGNYKMVFVWRNYTYTSGKNPPAAVDNIKIKRIICTKPTSLAYTELWADSVAISWDEVAAANWEYALVAASADGSFAEPTEYIATTENSLLLRELTENTSYRFYLHKVCDEENSDDIFIDFLTPQKPVQVGASAPYSDDFEAGNNWVLVNGDLENKWVYGTAAHNGEGTHALYISNDGGTTNAYTNNKAVVVFAKKAFEFEEGGYIFQYDWRAVGEGTSTLYDYLRVALIPADVELTASTSLPTGVTYQALPAGCIALDGRLALNQQADWQTFTSDQIVVPAGTYNVVIMWRDDTSSGTNPPAAVDNFSITAVSCAAPANLRADSVLADSAYIKWDKLGTEEHWMLRYKANGAEEWDSIHAEADSIWLENLTPATVYEMQVAAWCNYPAIESVGDFSTSSTFTTECVVFSAFPYKEGFDSLAAGTSGHMLPLCWDYINTCTSGSYNYYPTVYKASAASNTPDNHLRFYSYYSSSTTTYTPEDQYAILPEMDALNTMRLKLNARANGTSSYYDATFYVGIMSDPADTATFVAVDTIQPTSTTYAPYVIPFNGYNGIGKYIAIKMKAADAAISGYTYSYRSVYIDDIVVEEIPSCLEPNNLAVIDTTITMNSAVLTWTAQGSETQWLVQYKKHADAEWITVPATNDTILLENLEAATQYDVQVAAQCNETEVSPYIDPISFITECDAYAMPFVENFNKLASGIPLCWDNSEGTTTNESYKWNRYVSNGDTCLRFNSYNNSSNLTNILATPAIYLSEPAILSFNWKNPTGGAAQILLSNGDTIVSLKNDLTGIANWTEYAINLSDYTGDTVTIYFAATSNFGNGDAYLYLDDVAFQAAPSCFKPQISVSVEEVGLDTAKISWTAAEEGLEYAYALKTADVAELVYTSIDTNVVVLNGLTPDSEYNFYIRKNCGNSVSEDIIASFQTKQLPADPANFSDDFENGNHWAFENNFANAWVYGEATSNGEGSHALYISNDGGTTNAYTKSGAGISYAMKTFEFAQGLYDFKYDWKANGESTYDFLRVALVPDSLALSSSYSTVATSSLPAGWIALDGGGKKNLQTTWKTDSVSELPVAAGLYKMVFVWRNDNSGGTDAPAAVDNISISKVACPAVDSLNVTVLSASSAQVKFVADAEQDTWEIALDTIADFNPDTVTNLITVHAKSYILTDLEAETTYYIYVRANCGEKQSKWTAKKSFKTAKACQNPDGLKAEAVSIDAATISWNTYNQTGFNLRYSTDGVNWIDSFNVATPYRITGLAANTQYRVQVQAACAAEDSTWSSTLWFKTVRGIPFEETFSATSMPAEWSQYQGLLSKVISGEATRTSATAWYFGTSNGVFDSHARSNIYGTTRYHWLQAPTLYVEGNVQLTFDVALTAYSGTNVPAPATTGTDDKFAVVISTDNGETWSILRQWDNAGSEYVYNNIANSANGEQVVINLSNYSGQAITVAFYGESTVSNADNNIHVDNVSIDLVPTCLKPTGLSISDVKAHKATLDWTNGEEGQTAWQIAIDTIAAFNPDTLSDLIDVTEHPYTLTNLLPSHTYYVYVRANCGEGDLSRWTARGNFRTTIACPAPTELTAKPTPGNGTEATLTWKAGAEENAWQLEYSLNANMTDSIVVPVEDTTYYLLENLTVGATYYVRVKANCGDLDGVSAYTAVVSFTTTNEYLLTINDKNTTTNGNVPIYGNYAEQLTRSQFIIPEAALEEMEWDSIQSITFYASNENVSWGVAEFEVYLAESKEATISAFANWENLDLVQSAGSLAISSNKMVVTFDSAYQYQGGNLLIGFKQTVRGSYTACSWYGVSAQGAAYSDYLNNNNVSTSAGQRNFLPKMTFKYVPGVAPACPNPKYLEVSNIGAYGATFSWKAVAGATWEYAVAPASEAMPAEFISVAEGANSVILHELTEATPYVFYLRRDCGENVYSDIISLPFETSEFATDLPYAEDFAQADNWKLINGSETNAWVIGEATSLIGDNALYISDNAASYEYDEYTASVSFATKLFNFAETGTYRVSYNWKNMGDYIVENDLPVDYLRVALAPADIQLTAGVLPEGLSHATLPTGWIALDNDSALYGQSNWQNMSVVVPVTGIYRLVFAWVNDDDYSDGDPAAIDNIAIRHQAFPTDIESGAGIESKAVKFIYNDQVYILLNGAVYNITGQKVELK